MIIYPAIDMRGGRCVRLTEGRFDKETVFADDPSEMAAKWAGMGAEWLHLVDLDGALAGESKNIPAIQKILQTINIPVELGGGIRSMAQIEKLLDMGISRLILGSAAVKNPQLIADGAKLFGSQCIVLAIDAKKVAEGKWEVYVAGGRKATGLDAVEWAKKAVALGAGEILLTSMDADGTKNGYDIELTKAISSAVNVPVIASGGAGKLEDFYEVLTEGGADAVLAASVFHYKTFTIREVKEYLQSRGIEVRL